MVKKIGQRKFLLKRGYLESELDKMSPWEAKRIIASIEKIEHPQGQRKVYSEKEINAIKEFVEWLKGRFDKRIDEQTAKYERNKSIDEIMEGIKKDVNLENAGITPEQCWEICQYVWCDFITNNYEAIEQDGEL